MTNMENSAPTNVTAVAGDTTVSLTWWGTGADGYNLYRSTRQTFNEIVPVAVKIGSLPFVDTGLKNGTTYYYQVTGTNSDGHESPRSATVAATPRIPIEHKTILTKEQAIQIATDFCQAISEPVNAAATAVYPAPDDDPDRPTYWQPRWLITFGCEAAVQVVDATGVISRYVNTALMNSDSKFSNDPLTHEAALELGARVLQETRHTASLGSPTALPLCTLSTTDSGSWMTMWPRIEQGIPLQFQHAGVALEAATGRVASVGLTFRSPSPDPVTVSVSHGEAIATALAQLHRIGANDFTPREPVQEWVQPNKFWETAREIPLPGHPVQLAWVCEFNSGNACFWVWVDVRTGAVIGGTAGRVR